MDPNLPGGCQPQFVRPCAGEDITIYGDGSSDPFCFVMLTTDRSNGEDDEQPQRFLQGPVNTGKSRELHTRELAEMVVAKIGCGSKVVYMGLLSDDPTQRRPDITLARARLGWEPRIKLSEGLDKTIEYFRKEITAVAVAAE